VTVYPRLRMRLSLAEQTLSGSWRARAIGSDDVRALGALMLAAYRGTVDDEYESETDAVAIAVAVAEVEQTLGGGYGPLLDDASFVVEEGGRIVGASMTTLFGSDPFLTYLVVDPEMQRRGIGTFLVAASGNALLSTGYARLDLFVTEANEPAVNLYRKLGFRVVDRVTEPP
jgi:ribosomal protein S18 acetylase RimI-like enzyme